MTKEELLQRKVDRQKRQIELLEELIESRSRDAYTINEELTRSVEELTSTQRALVDASRRAGMADVATSVLHDVGNVLNSINVAANVLHELLRTTKAGGVGKAVALLRAQPDPGRFLMDDPRGRKLLDYLDGVVEAMMTDAKKASAELTGLERNIEHVKAVVRMQQAYARGGGAIERVVIGAAIREGLRMAAGSFERQQIEVVCELDDVADASITIDRHKLFQILVNLLTNAAHALKPRSSDRRITISARALDGDRLEIRVRDNGIGIPAENLTKIFGHGFTTRAEGHGFGLHSCANAATEMGGWLEAQSDGPNQGATFTLVVPRTARPAVTSTEPSAVSASP